jgi:hypothetical protein
VRDGRGVLQRGASHVPLSRHLRGRLWTADCRRCRLDHDPACSRAAAAISALSRVAVRDQAPPPGLRRVPRSGCLLLLPARADPHVHLRQARPRKMPGHELASRAVVQLRPMSVRGSGRLRLNIDLAEGEQVRQLRYCAAVHRSRSAHRADVTQSRATPPDCFRFPQRKL